uniref:T9SS type A sorting domain-containing protein n=1 Tax=candidate division WOR-3 bacterium TaxID=2052148 RepID=A0A7C4GK06_UNCW3
MIRHLLLALALCLPTLPSARACTIGAFGAGSTHDGRMLLWKNRDVTNPDQALRFFPDAKFPFVANIYAGESSEVWAGINSAGFAVMNSNAFNLGGFADAAAAADDGIIMHLALAGCATLDDFARLLDSLNIVGRNTTANFGAFDSTGACAIFEASNTWYVRCNTADDSFDFLLRANYAMAGDTIRRRGLNRFKRAMELVLPRARAQTLDTRFVIQNLCRDLGQVGFDPYPLPFTGSYGILPPGFLPTDSTISRNSTRSVEVMVGPPPGCGPGRGMMWFLPGSPDVSLPIPVWVAGGAVPEVLGPARALLCDEAGRVHDYIHSDPDFPSAVNTVALAQVLRFFAPRESTLFALVDSAESSWSPAGPDSTRAARLTARVCSLALAAYADFWDYIDGSRPGPLPPVETIPAFARGTVTFRLPADLRGRRLTVYDATGRQAAAIPTSESQPQFVWEPSGLRPGTYFVAVPGARVFRLTYLR